MTDEQELGQYLDDLRRSLGLEWDGRGNWVEAQPVFAIKDYRDKGGWGILPEPDAIIEEPQCD